MAEDTRQVVITIKLDEDSGPNPTQQTNTDAKGDKDNASKAFAKFLVLNALESTANEVVAWAEYDWNKDLMLTDDYVGQRAKRIAITQIGKATSMISTVGSMTASGAVFGPAGAIVGAVLGTSIAVSQIVRENVQGQEQQKIRLEQMDAQLGFTRSRAGWSTKAASIGEDL